jgi:serine/threonine protein kinase
MLVDSPFITKLFYSLHSKENFYLVMEHVSGGDCFGLLQTAGALHEDLVRGYVAEVVLALEHMHKLGIVHRDVKVDHVRRGAGGASSSIL